MYELSVRERERVYDDIHGIKDKIKETPELIDKAIQEMDFYLAQTPKSHRETWDLAIFLKPTLAKDHKFKLMFVRAEKYDGKKAAARLCKYFR